MSFIKKFISHATFSSDTVKPLSKIFFSDFKHNKMSYYLTSLIKRSALRITFFLKINFLLKNNLLLLWYKKNIFLINTPRTCTHTHAHSF